ncbi:MAG: cytochrome-c peroxidase [Rickettsiales bacterium]|nr:cytochrome-c peroxidase [Rickettsiales bacterium]
MPALPALAQQSDVKPIPKTVKVDAKKAELGEKLFNDTRLSADGTISCASCHALHKGGTDRLAVSAGIRSQNGPINSPTVFNSENNFVQFWDGRAADLTHQALGPVENSLEMGETWPNVVKKIQEDPEYVKAFKATYGGKITKDTIAAAIAEFERTLITPGSRFDQYLEGNKDALTAQEQRGYQLFNEKGCNSCHSGTYLGGTTYQQLNPDYFKARGGKITDADKGRYNVTKKEEDMHFFKVPMLRNVAVTAPYFHDGKVKTLEQAVKTMAKYQLGEELKDQDAKDIAAFLKSLTGTYKGQPLDKIMQK